MIYVLRSETGRIGRWRLFLQDFDFTVHHIPGVSNIIADSLSRCCAILDANRTHIETVHNDMVGHHGITQTLRMLKAKHISWLSMRNDVVQFIHSCPICQKSRVTQIESNIPEYHAIEAYEPFEEVSLDSMINLPVDERGNRHILVVIDTFTKFVELFPVKDLSADTAAQCLLQVCCRYGFLSFIRSDNGGQFVADVFATLVELMGSKQILTVGYRPQANGIVERANGEVKRHLSAIVNAKRIHSKWSLGLPLVQRILNTTVHSVTGYAPAALLYGNSITFDRSIFSVPPDRVNINVPQYVKELCAFQAHAIAASQSHMASIIDSRVSKYANLSRGSEFKEFKVGDYVISLNRVGDKFDYKWRGPYLVTGHKEANIYTCKDLRTNAEVQFDITTLRLFICPPNVDPVTIAGLDEDEYLVRAVLDHRLEGENKKLKTHYYFKVQFSDNTEHWLPYMEVRDLSAFDEYLRKNPKLVSLLKLKLSKP